MTYSIFCCFKFSRFSYNIIIIGIRYPQRAHTPHIHTYPIHALHVFTPEIQPFIYFIITIQGATLVIICTYNYIYILHIYALCTPPLAIKLSVISSNDLHYNAMPSLCNVSAGCYHRFFYIYFSSCFTDIRAILHDYPILPTL